MYIYFIIFFISFIFAYLSENTESIKTKKTLMIISILIPCILASLRAEGVGTDTSHYIKTIFNYSNSIKSFSFNSLFNNYNNIEILYWIMNYIITRFTNSINVVYFFIQLLVNTFINISCFKYSKIMNKSKHFYSFSYLVFLILYFNQSLNISRQYIAMSIVIFASTFIYEKKFFKFLFLIFIAFLFHKSTIICLPMYLIYNFKFLGKKITSLIKYSFIFLLVIFILNYKKMVLLLTNVLGLLGEKYLYYINSSTFLYIEFIFYLLVFIFLLLFIKWFKSANNINWFLIYLLVLGLILYFLGLFGEYAFRFAYYYLIFTIFCIPQIPLLFNKKQRRGIKFLLIICLCMYSFLYYEIAGYCETVPYVIDVRKN